MISAIEREPGSTWPSARSPRKEARPRIAAIAAVAAALSSAHWRTRASRSAGAASPARAARCTGRARRAASSAPTSALPRRVSAAIAAASAAARSAGPARPAAPAPSVIEQGAEHRPRRAADRAHAGGAGRLQRLVQRAGVLPVAQARLDRQRAALHVQAVVAVADGAVELGQLVDVIDQRSGRGDGSAIGGPWGGLRGVAFGRPAQPATRRPAASNQSGRSQLDARPRCRARPRRAPARR